jgi:SnoaL-like protein
VEGSRPRGPGGRSLVERLSVRFPGILRALTRFLLARPPSLLRERILTRFIRGVYEAFNRQDFELNTLFFDPDHYEFRPGDIANYLPDGREVYVGKAGYIEANREFREAWASVRVELVSIEEASPDRLVTLAAFHAAGGGSGLELSQETLSVFDMRNGLVIRQTFWLDVASGRRALADG